MNKNRLWLIILFAVVVYLSMAVYADLDNLSNALRSFNWIYLVLLILLTTTGYLIRFLKWNYFLKQVPVKIGLMENLFVFFSGLAMIITPAKLGEIWKGWLIKDINGEDLGKTVPVVIVDRFTDLIALVLLSLLGILYYEEGLSIIIIFVIIFSVFIVLIKSERISSLLLALLEKRAGKYSRNIKTMHHTFQKTMTIKNLISMSLLGVLAWFMECLGLFLVVQGFGGSTSLILSVFIFSFASLAGAASMIPGGLGVAEATLSGLLKVFGLTSTMAIATALIVRFGTLWYGAILGLAVYLIFKNRIINGKNLNRESD
ncbi:MAG: lysylphosphatidylglycerol synthase transmembrane domain-containing protein [Methanobacteriaceae archaeon]|nr:lysylphosphatidylglycerol synthase transmembrane domain-containing protein [Methanobacteriaceae archaeon]